MCLWRKHSSHYIVHIGHPAPPVERGDRACGDPLPPSVPAGGQGRVGAAPQRAGERGGQEEPGGGRERDAAAEDH